jgi:hypothetical protein
MHSLSGNKGRKQIEGVGEQGSEENTRPRKEQ